MELMVGVIPELYGPYITYSNMEVLILYVRLFKTLYGMLRAALLFYTKRLLGDQEDIGVVMNPQKPCVANLSFILPGNYLAITRFNHTEPRTQPKIVIKLQQNSQSLRKKDAPLYPLGPEHRFVLKSC